MALWRDAAVPERAGRALKMMTLYRTPGRAYRNRLLTSTDSPRPITYHLRTGTWLTVESGPADVRIINEIWLDRQYEKDERLVPTPRWTVLDLGANKGIFAARILFLAPEADVHCYEPDPVNYRYLIKNVGDRVVHHHAAVGSTPGTAVLHRVPGQGGLASVVEGRLQARGISSQPVTVPRASLGSIVGAIGQIDLAKIDVEGAEYDIVMRSDPKVFDAIDRIVMEYDAVDPLDSSVTGDTLVRHLTGLGYEVDPGPSAHRQGQGARIMTAIRSGL